MALGPQPQQHQMLFLALQAPVSYRIPAPFRSSSVVCGRETSGYICPTRQVVIYRGEFPFVLAGFLPFR